MLSLTGMICNTSVTIFLSFCSYHLSQNVTYYRFHVVLSVINFLVDFGEFHSFGMNQRDSVLSEFDWVYVKVKIRKSTIITLLPGNRFAVNFLFPFCPVLRSQVLGGV